MKVVFVAAALLGDVEVHFSWQAQYSGAVFGEVQVSLVAAGAVLAEVGVSFFVVGQHFVNF